MILTLVSDNMVVGITERLWVKVTWMLRRNLVGHLEQREWDEGMTTVI